MNFFKKALCITLAAAALTLTPAALADDTGAVQSYETGDTFSLTIMHTNDIHGNDDRLPMYATYIEEVRDENPNVLVLDGGDIFRRGEFEEYRGQVETEIFNVIGYDACVLGNNDFNVPSSNNDAGVCNDMISALARTNNAPILCANVLYTDSGEYLDGTQPYTIVERSGVRIGIIGVTSTKPQERGISEVADKNFLNAYDTLVKCIDELDGQTDINIVLSHAGMIKDTQLSQLGHADGNNSIFAYRISAILSADDHLPLTAPLYFYFSDDAVVPVFQHGGEATNSLGRLDLEFEVTEDGFKLTGSDGYICDISQTEPNADVQAILDGYRALAADGDNAA